MRDVDAAAQVDYVLLAVWGLAKALTCPGDQLPDGIGWPRVVGVRPQQRAEPGVGYPDRRVQRQREDQLGLLRQQLLGGTR